MTNKKHQQTCHSCSNLNRITFEEILVETNGMVTIQDFEQKRTSLSRKAESVLKVHFTQLRRMLASNSRFNYPESFKEYIKKVIASGEYYASAVEEEPECSQALFTLMQIWQFRFNLMRTESNEQIRDRIFAIIFSKKNFALHSFYEEIIKRAGNIFDNIFIMQLTPKLLVTESSLTDREFAYQPQHFVYLLKPNNLVG
ncbi:MAG TPA: hypothetical protein PKN75_14520 [Bacteroidia bacterium]|nr:hypothetical protein [Bacteroidia bacterium]HNU34799.1 hypothetical protein [Bacteroidia bacterium]